MSTMFIWLVTLLVIAEVAKGSHSEAIYERLVQSPGNQDMHTLPDLPYGYSDLEPFIDEMTMKIHHLGHHKGYTTRLNGAIREWKKSNPNSELARSSISKILRNIEEVPSNLRTAIINNGGGYVNHIIYWASMCPGGDEPRLCIKDLIEKDFRTMSNFKKEFTKHASSVFGSGYTWLVMDQNRNRLKIISTKDQDSPISQGLYPILVIDIWEHAYYLKHKNKRAHYIEDWWSVLCWDEVEKMMEFWKENPLQVSS